MKNERTTMQLIRRIAFVLIALAAVAVWVFMAPQPVDAPDAGAYKSKVKDIEATNDANNAYTDGAPQQEVVNGWTSIEYLDLISGQLNELPGQVAPPVDQRPAALLALLVVAACLHFATSSSSGVVVQRVVPRPAAPAGATA